MITAEQVKALVDKIMALKARVAELEAAAPQPKPVV